MNATAIENKRVSIQTHLDGEKTQAQRNRLGQFSTPTALAQDVLRCAVELLGKGGPLRFLDPAIGTGSFFSALLHTVPAKKIESAQGFEVDPHYGQPAVELWKGTPLEITLADFTRCTPPDRETERFNLLICNPPYVRHHHIPADKKPRLQRATQAACGVHIGGLAGLYCYFLGLSHAWMQKDAIATWLIPSEFMDVNYGAAVKKYLLEKVTLLRIHRFNPQQVQFDDALVSSAVVFFRNTLPPAKHQVNFTYGGSLLHPELTRNISPAELQRETKWTRFPGSDIRKEIRHYCLSDLFTIQRGIATGENKFFILSGEQIKNLDLPINAFRPILPSPRYMPVDEIEADEDGLPLLTPQLFLLNCALGEEEIKRRHPKLWDYLQSDVDRVAGGYLCRKRKPWYSQEQRNPAPLLCTYMGRMNTKSGRPFRFILNHSRAVASNVYLFLYPKPILAGPIARNHTLLRKIWTLLNKISPEMLLGEGRVYGGGLHKLEPKELGNVDATAIVKLIPTIQQSNKVFQQLLFAK